jgi:HPt (histidine-containing phosphotransfer) domain-containing protein
MTSTALCLRLGDDHPFAPAERLFRQMAAERLDKLSTAWMRLETGQHVREALADVRHIAHIVAGTAPSIGHSELGVLADRLERLASDNAVREEVLAELRPFMTYLADLAED